MDVEGKRWPILQRLIIYNRIADKLLVFACLLCVINIFIWSRYFTYINPNRPEDRGGRCNSWSLLQKVETRESIRTFPPQTKGGHILVGGLILAGIFIIKKLVTHVRVIDPRKETGNPRKSNRSTQKTGNPRKSNRSTQKTGNPRKRNRSTQYIR